jgi:hypothetical protein
VPRHASTNRFVPLRLGTLWARKSADWGLRFCRTLGLGREGEWVPAGKQPDIA